MGWPEAFACGHLTYLNIKMATELQTQTLLFFIFWVAGHPLTNMPYRVLSLPCISLWGHLETTLELIEVPGGYHPRAQPLFLGHTVLIQYRHVIPSEEGYSFTKIQLTPNTNYVTSNTYMIYGETLPTGGWGHGLNHPLIPQFDFKHFNITLTH